MSEPTAIHQRTHCDLEGVDEEWDIDDLDESAELKDAIEQARDDHDYEYAMEIGNVWMAKVAWNENTDSVWVSLFGYHGGYEVVDE